MENADVELPLIIGTQGDEYDDIRFTDRDMILARSDVAVSNPAAFRYESILPTVTVEAFGTVFEIDVPRGFVAVDATVGPRTYRFLLSAGYTWGHQPDLRNEEPTLSQRLDLILVRGSTCPHVPAFLVGADPAYRTPSGLWPSDHAGVVARLRMPDAAHLLCYLFLQGPPPRPPFPSAGTDPTPDGLGCR